jgi:hypothetical protein
MRKSIRLGKRVDENDASAAETGERPFGSCTFQNYPRFRLQVRALRPQPICESSRKLETLTSTTASIRLIEETRGGHDFTTPRTGQMPTYMCLWGEECDEFTPTVDAAGKCVWTKVLPVLSRRMRQNRALTVPRHNASRIREGAGSQISLA